MAIPQSNEKEVLCGLRYSKSRCPTGTKCYWHDSNSWLWKDSERYLHPTCSDLPKELLGVNLQVRKSHWQSVTLSFEGQAALRSATMFVLWVLELRY
jgi:hypothetical protein